MQLSGRVAVVTGAASGIGRASAEALARRGCSLALVDVDPAGLAETARRVAALGAGVSEHLVDVSDRGAMEALPARVLDHHGHAHLLLNNAGVSVAAELAEHSLDDFEWLVGINFWGVVYGCKFFLPHLLREEAGHIVNVSSVFGLIGFPGQTSYCATKFAVRGFSEALRIELDASGVGVTSVHPGPVRTNILAALRTGDEAGRRRQMEFFAERAVAPERVAARIVRAVERGQPRVLVTREARLADWVSRLSPGLTRRILVRGYRRLGAEEENAG